MGSRSKSLSEYVEILKPLDVDGLVDWNTTLSDGYIIRGRETQIRIKYHNIDDWAEQRISHFKNGARHQQLGYAKLKTIKVKDEQKVWNEIVEVDNGETLNLVKTKESFVYKGRRHKSTMVDKDFGEFNISIGSFLSGTRHTDRATSGINKNLPINFYILEVQGLDGKTYQKAGVTNRIVKSRYTNPEWKHARILFEQEMEGTKALELETSIKRRLQRYLIEKENFPLKSGFTECYDYDVVGLIK